ncbi:hypothetical protein ACFYO7_31020 [Nocardia salmonicida]|uniref:hypothetical protein n=1 Tax=Nocardia salmonicida TaxID=53431 RepID=UPI003680D15A
MTPARHSAANTVAVICGASEWPRLASRFTAASAFANTATRLRAYLHSADGLALPEDNMLWLFDSTTSAAEHLEQIHTFLIHHTRQANTARGSGVLVLFLYVGHGAFFGDDRAYSLLIRDTREPITAETSLRVASVGSMLRATVPESARVIVLDACFAGVAFKDFQSDLEQLTHVKIEEALEMSRSTRGVALLCAASKRNPARLAEPDTTTLFGRALLDVLHHGDPHLPGPMSVRRIGELISQHLENFAEQDAPRPEVHAPDQRGGDLAGVPLFPNPATTAVQSHDAFGLKRYDAYPASPRLREDAQARFSKGVVLGTMGRSAEAIAIYEHLISDYADNSDPDIKRHVAKTMVNKGFRLAELGRSEEAIGVNDQVVRAYVDDPDPAIREQVAKALVNKGVVLDGLSRVPEELDIYEQVVTEYGEDSGPGIKEQVAKALVNKGITLGRLARVSEELDVYEQVITSYSGDPTPALRERVADTLFSKGVVLSSMGRSEDAINAYGQVIDGYRNELSPTIKELVAKAAVNKGFRQAELGWYEEAIATYDQLVTDYTNDPNLPIKEQVVKALVNKGVALDALSCFAMELDVYEQVIADYADESNPIIMEQVAKAAVNKGIVLGRPSRAARASNEV